jgi:hypothetical protein
MRRKFAEFVGGGCACGASGGAKPLQTTRKLYCREFSGFAWKSILLAHSTTIALSGAECAGNLLCMWWGCACGAAGGAKPLQTSRNLYRREFSGFALIPPQRLYRCEFSGFALRPPQRLYRRELSGFALRPPESCTAVYFTEKVKKL